MEKATLDLVPPKVRSDYGEFRYVTDTATCHVVKDEEHVIRILDRRKKYTKENFAHAATLFVQELLRLQYLCPGSVLINTLEINENVDQIACATLSSVPLSSQLEEKGTINLKDPETISKLLSDVIGDIEFLLKDLKVKNIASIINLEDICYLREKGKFFLGNWAKIYESSGDSTITSISFSQQPPNKKITSQDLAEEI